MAWTDLPLWCCMFVQHHWKHQVNAEVEIVETRQKLPHHCRYTGTSEPSRCNCCNQVFVHRLQSRLVSLLALWNESHQAKRSTILHVVESMFVLLQGTYIFSGACDMSDSLFLLSAYLSVCLCDPTCGHNIWVNFDTHSRNGKRTV